MTDGNIKTIIQSLTTSSDFNGNVCKKIIESIYDIQQITTIIACQKIIEIILLNHIIINKTNTKEPETVAIPEEDKDTWVSEFKVATQSQQILLTANDYQLMKEISTDLKIIEKELSKIKTIKQNFTKQLNEALETMAEKTWSSMNKWLDEKLIPIINNQPSNIKIEHYKKTLSDYANNILSNLKEQLDKEIKDFLHSKTNKDIILNKKNDAENWNNELKNQLDKNNPLIESIEKDIHEKLKEITQPIDSPFIKQFYNELFTRCYKKLLSPEKKTEPTQLVKQKTTPDINKHQLKKMKEFPSEIQHDLDELLLPFLEYICNNKTDIKKFVQSKSKKLTKILANKDLSTKQKTTIQRLYFNLYKSIRHYEKSLTYASDQLNNIETTNLTNTIQAITRLIELIYHEYRPLLNNYINQITEEITKNNVKKRRQLIITLDNEVKRLRDISKIIEITRVINKIMEKKNKNLDELISNSTHIQSLIDKNQWKTFFKVWNKQESTVLDWLESISKEIQIQVNTPIRKSRTPLKKNEITHPNSSSLIKSNL